MGGTRQILDLLFSLLFAVVVPTAVARRLQIAFLVLIVPGVPAIALPPNLVFVLFLLPLLYWESLNISYRDLRFGIRPILSLTVGLDGVMRKIERELDLEQVRLQTERDDYRSALDRARVRQEDAGDGRGGSGDAPEKGNGGSCLLVLSLLRH